MLLEVNPNGGQYGLLSVTDPDVVQRAEGLRQILAGTAWTEVDGSPAITEEGNITLALEQMNDYINTYPEIGAIIPMGGWPMFGGDGGWETFVEANRELTYVSADALPIQVDLLERGFADGLVGQLPYLMGTTSIDTLLALAKGESVDEIIDTDLVKVVRTDGKEPTYAPSAAPTSSTGSSAGIVFVSAVLACSIGFVF
jgi:ribose transport system substrate-binding protein